MDDEDTQPPDFGETESVDSDATEAPDFEHLIGLQNKLQPSEAVATAIGDENDEPNYSQKTVELNVNEQNDAFKILGTAIINDEPDSETGVAKIRRVLVCKYDFEEGEKTTAFYQSSGSSHGTSAFLKNTFFPFYGEDRSGHLIKAPEISMGSYFSVPKWKSEMKKYPFHAPKDILKYFDNYSELQISARFGEGWWETPVGKDLQSKILTNSWVQEMYKRDTQISQIDIDKHFALFQPQILSIKGNNINTFLREFGALRVRESQEKKVGGGKITHKKRSKVNNKTRGKNTKKTKKTKKSKRNKRCIRRTFKRRR